MTSARDRARELQRKGVKPEQAVGHSPIHLVTYDGASILGELGTDLVGPSSQQGNPGFEKILARARTSAIRRGSQSLTGEDFQKTLIPRPLFGFGRFQSRD